MLGKSRLVREDDDDDGDGIMDTAMSFGEAARRTNSTQVRTAVHGLVSRPITQLLAAAVLSKRESLTLRILA